MVFVPLSDDNPRLLIRYPYVSWGLIAANLIIYVVFESGFVLDTYQASVFSFGVIPSVVFGNATLPPELISLPGPLTFLTSLFLHGDIIHLVGNLLFIYVFADNIEDSMGHLRFILFYCLCGMAGGAAHALAMPMSEAPLIGASGAISGVVAAYLLLHPRVKMWILLFGRIPLRVTASWIIVAWVAVQLASGFFSSDEAIAWWAHMGGFVAGVLLLPLLKRSDVPWFGRPPKTI